MKAMCLTRSQITVGDGGMFVCLFKYIIARNTWRSYTNPEPKMGNRQNRRQQENSEVRSEEQAKKRARAVPV